MQDLKTALQQEMHTAILAYNMNRVQLVQTALNEGGPEAVAQLEDQFVALCNAEHQLTQTALNENHPHYQRLMTDAVESGNLLQESILEMQALDNILDVMAKTVTLVGRILLMLAT